MNAEIITVGTELLLGDIAGSNSQFLSHELATYGIQVTYLTTIANDLPHLREALRHALGRTELVILSGGLDENGNGQTRGAVSDVLSIPLELHNESWERIREYYLNTCREMPADSQRQAMLPRGCTVFPNDHGTAPGCVLSRYGQQILMLPGTPGELYPMFSDYVAPYLSLLVDGTTVSRTVGVFGLSETVLNERLADLMSEANPSVASYPKDGEAILRVTAHATDRKAALALCDPVVEEIRKRLSVNVYGVDIGSLQKAVVVLLLDRHMKIATAESCTAGLLSGRLTEVSGVSAVFECGVAAYSKEIKHNILGVPTELIDTYGTVSPEVASAMAVGVRRVGNASLGVSITGVAGPETSEGKPVGTVYIALADEKRVWVKKIDTKEGTMEREYVRWLATSYALDLARRYLEALPTVMAGGEIIEPETVAPPTIPEGDTIKRKQSFLRHFLPWKGDGKFEIIRKSAILVALLLLLAAMVSLLYLRVFRPLDNVGIYRHLGDLYNDSNAVIPVDNGADYPEGMLTRFYYLYNRNKDIRGWVKIDGTNISYPVMRDSGDHYYDDHNFYKLYSKYGAPYFDANTAVYSPDSVNRSIVIYGNNTDDGQMFSDLGKYYNDLDYLRAHPVVEMDTLYHENKWKIISVMILPESEDPVSDGGSGDAFNYKQTVFADDADFLNFAGQIKARSLYSFSDGQADVQADDSLLLLSANFTGSSSFEGARLVIAARQIRAGESETMDLTDAAYNADAVMPDEWSGTKTSATEKSKDQPISSHSAEASSAVSDAGTSSRLGADSSADESSAAPATSALSTSQATTQPTKAETEGPTTQPDNADTTTKTASLTTAPVPSEADPSSIPPVIAGSVGETAFLRNCQVLDKANGNELLQPADRQELQMLLARTVKQEMGNAGMMGNDCAALKAQTVASYTYILNYNQTHGAPYPYSLAAIDLTNPTDKKIYDAVGEVAGIKILAGSTPICAMYCSSTPGVTADNTGVFGADLPYLKSVASKYDSADFVSGWHSTAIVSMSTLTQKLSDYFGTAIYYEEGKTPFYVRSYDDYGKYALETNAYYLVNGQKHYVTGYQMRTALNKGSASEILRSHCFYVTSCTDSQLTLDVYGWGHGVGMSQWGAVGYATQEGWDYQRILSHYYSITYASNVRLVYPVW